MSDCPDNTPLGNSISVLSGFPFPSAQFTEGIGKPLIRIRDLIGSRTETNFVGDFDPAFLIRHDDVLIGMDGDFNVVRWKGPEALLNQRVCKVSSASDEIDERFLFWWLKPHIQIVHRRTPQTTVRHLSVGDVYRIPKPTLVSKAQAFAAVVLDTVDEAIAKTEAVIAKLRQVRAGLLHDLLTRGLDQNGQLRDSIANPEQFQDSPLGRIPKEWTVRSCQSLCREIVVGIVVKPAQYYVEDGVPVLRSANIREGGIQLSDLVFISPASNMQLSKSMLRTDDVVTVRTGYPGTTCVVPSHLDGANCVDLIISRPGKEIVPKFLALWVNSSFGKDQVLRVQGGLAQQHFNVGEMKTLLVARPEPDEQKAIVERLEALDSQIAVTTGEQAKLSLLKSGLMTDLLTGRVRVPEAIGT